MSCANSADTQDFHRQLKQDYVDLYLVHWPQAATSAEQAWASAALQPEEHPTFNETWADMEKVYEKGKAKAKAAWQRSVEVVRMLYIRERRCG